jgi:hypothetical protein
MQQFKDKAITILSVIALIAFFGWALSETDHGGGSSGDDCRPSAGMTIDCD